MAQRVVWVLGAGFSMPLGGPSLDSLLSDETKRVLELLYPVKGTAATREYQNLLGDAASAARWFRNYGRGQAAGSFIGRPGEELWADAEDFFDKLDEAVRQGPLSTIAKRYEAILNGPGLRSGPAVSLESVRDATKRLLAFE